VSFCHAVTAPLTAPPSSPWLSHPRTLRITYLISSMTQTTHRVVDVNNPGTASPVTRYAWPLLADLIISTDGNPNRPQSTPDPPSQDQSNFGDSSGPFFSIYSKTAEEEDNEMVDRWQKDADGILIFVSSRICNHIVLYINRNTIDWSILSRGCCTPCFDRPRPEAK
jgi:hypothetical protein